MRAGALAGGPAPVRNGSVVRGVPLPRVPPLCVRRRGPGSGARSGRMLRPLRPLVAAAPPALAGRRGHAVEGRCLRTGRRQVILRACV